jgi:hypothetical protein
MLKTRFHRAYGYTVWTEVAGKPGEMMVKIIPNMNTMVIADKRETRA